MTGSGNGPKVPSNHLVAQSLSRVATLLASQHANPFRVNAYRNAAQTVERLPTPVSELLQREGRTGLERLPAVGSSIAAAIAELVETGRWGLLERLEGHDAPEDLFTSLPGVGEVLAARIHRTLHVDTLEELELCAHDGRLESVRGVGKRRAAALRDVLAARLSRSVRRHARHVGEPPPARQDSPRPSIELLLALDQEYRDAAQSGRLKTVAPRRFNPSGVAWLPVLHTEREGWHLSALYSNTARAHWLGTTRDWVIVYYERDGHEGQCTIVTEQRGPFAGCRVVRGRERECVTPQALCQQTTQRQLEA